MLVSTLQEERQKVYQQGQADGEAVGIVKGEAVGIVKGEAVGIVKGEVVGLVKGQRQTLLLLLQYRYQLSEAEQTNLAEQLAKITEAQSLTALTNHGLQAASFEEFKTYLLGYLPTDSGG